MVNVCVCIGGSCHMRGSSAVSEELKRLIIHRRLTNQIELQASFCMGDCANGVCMTVDGKKVRSVTKENVNQIFEREILPLVEEK